MVTSSEVPESIVGIMMLHFNVFSTPSIMLTFVKKLYAWQRISDAQ
jgi:hypothetical protein